MKSLKVVINCDTDPDRPDFGGTLLNQGSAPHVWRGVEQIDKLRDRLLAYKDSDDRPFVFTWMLRCDENIKGTHGSEDYLIRHYKNTWDRMNGFGDEIGWHPHFFRIDDDQKSWFQETNDLEYIKSMMSSGHKAFIEAHGEAPKSVRTGWTYHNDTSMAHMNDLGLSVDCSGMPYQEFSGSHNDRGSKFQGAYDWSKTPAHPYRPTRENYQAEGTGDDKLNMIHLPNSYVESKLIGFLSDLRVAVRERSISKLIRLITSRTRVVRTTIKACAPPLLFRSMVQQVLDRGDEWLVTYFHPDEFLPDKGQFINNRIHKFEHLEQNIKSIIKLCKKHGRPLKSLTASQAADHIRHAGI